MRNMPRRNVNRGKAEQRRGSVVLTVAVFVLLVVSPTSNGGRADAAETESPNRAKCVSRSLSRPAHFGEGRDRFKRNILRDFQWNGQSARWHGSYSWTLSFGLHTDEVCADLYRRAVSAKVRIWAQARGTRGKSQRATGWRHVWAPYSPSRYLKGPYSTGLQGETRSQMAGTLGKIRRAVVFVKLELISKIDGHRVGVRVHRANMMVRRDFCFGHGITSQGGGYGGGYGNARHRPSCRKKYPGYDQNGKVDYFPDYP